MTLDVGRVRAAFPALDLGVAHFDGPGGSQVPRVVADAVARTLVSGISNRGAVSDAERRADDAVLGARAAVADLLGADPGGVVFGRSMTQITYDVARALATTLGSRRRGRRDPAGPRREHPALGAGGRDRRRDRPAGRRSTGRPASWTRRRSPPWSASAPGWSP